MLGEFVGLARRSRCAVSSIMSEQEVHTSVAQRVIIKFLAWEGVRPSEILRLLFVQFCNETLSRTQVYDWHKKFSDGRETVGNETHARRPRTTINEANIHAIRELIEGDRHLTVLAIAEQVGISYGSAQSTISDELGFRKVCARWVPRLLREDQKANRLAVCERLLARYQAEGDKFLRHIVTCDKTWVHHYTTGLKRANME